MFKTPQLSKLLRIFLFLLIVFLIFIHDNIHHLVKSYSVTNTKPSRVLFMVLTSEENIVTRGIPLWRTWGKHTDNLVFACNCANVLKLRELMRNGRNYTEIPNDLKIFLNATDLPILHIEGVQESPRIMNKKVLAILNASYAIYANKVNWYYMVDDDAYVFVDNLNKFISTKNTSEAYVYGFQFKHRPKPGGFVYGGPGILLANESMRLLVDRIRRDNCKGHIDRYGYGDVTIGMCGYASGVRIINPLDEFGRQLWHHDDPITHFNGTLHRRLKKQGTHNGKQGKECCSLQSIGFHRINASMMHDIYNNKNYLKDLLT